MLSSESFLRTASSGMFDNNGVKTPTRIAPMSPQKSPAILSPVAYVTLRSCGNADCVGVWWSPRIAFGRMFLYQPRRLLFLWLLFSIAPALVSAQTALAMPVPLRGKQINLDALLAVR